jgi:transposase-like protein
LADAIKYFGDPDNSLRYLAAKRWPNGVECPYCAAKEPMFLKSRRIWKCRATDCRKQFSVKVGTVLNESPLPVEKWLTAMWLVANCRNGVSSCEIARDLGLTQKTAWFMLHRIREAMQDKTATKLAGEVEVDESFIGGKSRNMHAKRRAQVITGTGGMDKAIALGMVERGAIPAVIVTCPDLIFNYDTDHEADATTQGPHGGNFRTGLRMAPGRVPCSKVYQSDYLVLDIK